MRLHVAIDLDADDASRPFFTVCETIDALGVLGAIADARAVPLRWVVLWLAKAPTDALGADTFDGPSSSIEIERRWNSAWRPWDAARDARYSIGDPKPLLSWPVLLVSRSGLAPSPLTAGREQAPLELCADDALLEANELPAFSRSTYRFLISRPIHGSPRFYWLSGGNGPIGSSSSVMELVQGEDDRVLFNAGAGLLGAGPLRVTPFQPMPYVEHAALLHGETPRVGATAPGAKSIEDTSLLMRAWEGAMRLRARPTDAGRLFGSLDPLALRHLEANYLRLRAVADMIASCRDAVDRSGLPLFNIAAESFASDIEVGSDRLPFLWQTSVRLARPGIARTFMVEASPPLRLFSRPASAGLDSLVPTEPATTFLCEVLLLDVADAGSGNVALKVQLVPRQAVSVSETDLLRFHLKVGGEQIAILARPARAMTGRQPFEARSMPFRPPADRAMRAGAQVSLLVETIPLEGTPHDLYSLFVLACRMLLAGGHPTARAAAQESEEAAMIAALRDAIGADGTRDAPARGPLFSDAGACAPALRPAPLVASEGSPDSWPSGISLDLWSDVLRAIASLRYGWPGCPCRDLAHFDPDVPARVFDAPLEAFESIARRFRVALLGHPAIDAEIRTVALELAAERRGPALAARS